MRLTFRASNNCLKCAGKDIQNVGMLIYSGVYSENHLKEPALASLLHTRLQRKNSQPKFLQAKMNNTFSFDLYNGGGGVLNAIQVIDGFIQSGEIESGLVVAGDTKPVSGFTKNYNYSSGAGAMFLTNGPRDKGFVGFQSDTYSEFINNLKSATNWDTGNFRFLIEQKKEFLNNCVDCALKSIHKFFTKENLNWGDVDFVIPSISPKGFSKELQRKLGLKRRFIQADGIGEIFSAGVFFNLDKVFHNEYFKTAKHILFITVGAGITVSISLYRN